MLHGYYQYFHRHFFTTKCNQNHWKLYFYAINFLTQPYNFYLSLFLHYLTCNEISLMLFWCRNFNNLSLTLTIKLFISIVYLWITYPIWKEDIPNEYLHNYYFHFCGTLENTAQTQWLSVNDKKTEPHLHVKSFVIFHLNYNLAKLALQRHPVLEVRVITFRKALHWALQMFAKVCRPWRNEGMRRGGKTSFVRLVSYLM